MPDLDAMLANLGLTLPPLVKPIAAYIPAVRSGNLLFISGQVPQRDGKPTHTGPIPSKTTIEQGQDAARQCVLQALAVVKDHLNGDWSRLVRVVRVGAFIQSDSGFGDQPKVANGASELLQQLLGEAGQHARAAIGTNALPRDASVEIEFLFEVR
jgi:enamine deaminase RidA (YjgF/YER057c/UK114 family)